jgi:uncharacterized protein YyaL (SSP411 family)
MAPDHGFLDHVLDTISRSYDWQNGGWGGAPKFPQPMLIEFLLRQASRGSKSSQEMAEHALRSMAKGGMYDVLGGGFSRYSVDPTWLIPHFEKMLYDNAQLSRTYLHAYQMDGDPGFREVCEATLEFVLREMTHTQGGFYSSLDADTEGEEGKYYLWSSEEIRSALPDNKDAELFISAYDVSDSGNFEGRNILRRNLSDEEISHQFHIEAHAVPGKLADLCRQLLMERNHRVRPTTDDKVLVSWNGLMLAAFSEAGRALDRPDFTQAATRNADFLLRNLLIDGKLMRSWRNGFANHNAYLEDYASLALGLISLYQSNPNPRWFKAARDLSLEILTHFSDPSGGFFDTRDDHETLLYRPKDMQDNATPSGSALTAMLLLQLAAYEGKTDWHDKAVEMLSSNLEMMKRYPSAFGQWLCTADFAVGPVNELAIIGDIHDPSTQSLVQPVWIGYHPRLVLAISFYPPPVDSPALLIDRPMLNARPTAFVCQGFVCQLPVNSVEKMLQQLAKSA